MTIDTWFLAHGELLQYLAYGAVLATFWLVELRYPARRQLARKAARYRANYALTALNVVVLGALPLSLLTAAHWAERQGLGVLRWAALPLGVAVALGLLARGFISWLTHLLMHRVPLLWRVHRVHHTDTELDTSTTVRFHPLEFPIGLVVGLPLVVTFGVAPWVLLAYEVLDVLVTVFSHSNIVLPAQLERFLRYVIVTPGLHRVHHSTRPEETNSNFSAVFPIWDLLFGTLRSRTAEPSLEMSLGLAEARGPESQSLSWLLRVPFLANGEEGALRTTDERRS